MLRWMDRWVKNLRRGFELIMTRWRYKLIILALSSRQTIGIFNLEPSLSIRMFHNLHSRLNNGYDTDNFPLSSDLFHWPIGFDLSLRSETLRGPLCFHPWTLTTTLVTPHVTCGMWPCFILVSSVICIWAAILGTFFRIFLVRSYLSASNLR